MTELLHLAIDALLGGGLLVTLFTLRSTRRKAKADANKMDIDNDRLLMDSFNSYIVEPLKKEVNALRRDVRRFSRAIERIASCAYADDCPVRRELLQANADEAEPHSRHANSGADSARHISGNQAR